MEVSIRVLGVNLDMKRAEYRLKPLVRKNSQARAHSTLGLRQKPATPARVTRIPESLPLLPSLAKVNQSLVLPKSHIQPEVRPHKHRLSIDGELGLQVMLMEQRDEKGRPKLKMQVKGALVNEPKKRNPQVQPRITHLMDADRDGDRLREYEMRRASLMTRSSISVQPPIETAKCVQRFAFRSQTGSIAGKSKKNNQDNYLICQDFAGGKNQWLFGVFDGHGPSGHDVSAYIKRSLPQHLHAFLSHNRKALSETEVMSLSQGFATCYQRIHAELQRSSHVDSSMSGSTAVSVLVQGDFLLCANTGDSRAVIGRLQPNDHWVSMDLSKDHKPDDPAEKARIERSGGRVEPSKGKFQIDHSGNAQGPARVWQPHEQTPGLAMSRSLGDTSANELGVTPEPDVTWLRLGREDQFLVLASDGVWEFLPSEVVVSLVAPYWSSGNVDGACDKLVKEALHCWRQVSARQRDEVVDDITVVLAFFSP